jgi:hypothetical protein
MSCVKGTLNQRFCALEVKRLDSGMLFHVKQSETSHAITLLRPCGLGRVQSSHQNHQTSLFHVKQRLMLV